MNNALYYYQCGLRFMNNDRYLAYEYFKRSANLGNTDAIIMLANYYENTKLYEKAANMGNSTAMCYLAIVNENNDIPKALYYYKLAIENGNKLALHRCGLFYYKRGEYNKAYVYWKLAKQNNNSEYLIYVKHILEPKYKYNILLLILISKKKIKKTLPEEIYKYIIYDDHLLGVL